MNIIVQKLDKPYHDGDWHDPMLKWEVLGPGLERQCFDTKKNATDYKRIRKASKSFKEAAQKYIWS